jgi:hypothetical protein
LANPDGGFLATSAVIKGPAVIDFNDIYLKVSLTPMAKKAGQTGEEPNSNNLKIPSVIRV